MMVSAVRTTALRLRLDHNGCDPHVVVSASFPWPLTSCRKSDCCDGTDETEGHCKNTCREEASGLVEDLKARLNDAQKGIRTRKSSEHDYKKALEEKKVELTKKEEEMPGMTTRYDEADTNKRDAEKAYTDKRDELQRKREEEELKAQAEKDKDEEDELANRKDTEHVDPHQPATDEYVLFSRLCPASIVFV